MVGEIGSQKDFVQIGKSSRQRTNISVDKKILDLASDLNVYCLLGLSEHLLL